MPRWGLYRLQWSNHVGKVGAQSVFEVKTPGVGSLVREGAGRALDVHLGAGGGQLLSDAVCVDYGVEGGRLSETERLSLMRR
jgi:hypothetical protein